ncbi:acyl-CoA thioesterase [Planctomycetes bacterium K23_9]|uniref:Acyl-ACP thioesterase n=1 Tax=Stieleria marina TaxID=1930275 RepID=A0A517P3F7_9BACT|nr:Acyl-ACP thioesterase [Planctomycetes bacterium K23_9]
MKPFFDLLHTVSADEIDAQQHVHNLRYLQWTLWAAGKHSAACGWDSQAALDRGMGWVVRKHDITYRAAAVADDEIVVRTWVADVASFAARRKYAVCRPSDQTVLARVETRWVYVDLTQHKVVPIPQELKSKMLVADRIPPLPWEQAND